MRAGSAVHIRTAIMVPDSLLRELRWPRCDELNEHHVAHMPGRGKRLICHSLLQSSVPAAVSTKDIGFKCHLFPLQTGGHGQRFEKCACTEKPIAITPIG